MADPTANRLTRRQRRKLKKGEYFLPAEKRHQVLTAFEPVVITGRRVQRRKRRLKLELAKYQSSVVETKKSSGAPSPEVQVPPCVAQNVDLEGSSSDNSYSSFWSSSSDAEDKDDVKEPSAETVINGDAKRPAKRKVDAVEQDRQLYLGDVVHFDLNGAWPVEQNTPSSWKLQNSETDVVDGGHSQSSSAADTLSEARVPKRGGSSWDIRRSATLHPDYGTTWENEFNHDFLLDAPDFDAVDREQCLTTGKQSPGASLNQQHIDKVMHCVPRDLLRKCWARAVHAASCKLPCELEPRQTAPESESTKPEYSSVEDVIMVATEYCDKFGIDYFAFEQVRPPESSSEGIEEIHYKCPSCHRQTFSSVEAIENHFLVGDKQSNFRGCCWNLVRKKQTQELQEIMLLETETLIDSVLHKVLLEARYAANSVISGVERGEPERFDWSHVLKWLQSENDSFSGQQSLLANEETMKCLWQRLLHRYGAPPSAGSNSLHGSTWTFS